jgi:DNA polymerase mu
LYDIGLRTIEDMERYYDVPAGGTYQAVKEEDILTPNGQPVPKTARMPDISVEVALSLRHHLQTTIPRAEVEEIYATVMSELWALQEGCVGTIVGGCAKFTFPGQPS